MIFNNIFDKDLQDEEWKKYWEELGVNFSKINESIEFNENIRKKIESLCETDYEILSDILDIDYDDNFIEKISKNDELKNILYLDNFLKRKKKAIDELYDSIFIKNDEYKQEASTIVKLLQLFMDKKVRLFEIYALNEWISKGTGIEYIANSKLNKKRIDEFLKKDELEKFCEFMEETPQIGTNYKLRMVCKYREKQIFLVYKLKNDTQMTDFDEAKRVKNIDKILFEIDVKNGYLHIKFRNYSERIQIKKYFEQYFKSTFNETETDIFENYDVDNFKSTFTRLESNSKDVTTNFYVTRMAFSNSLLDKSPELTFDGHKRDVWPSIVHAFNMKIVDIDSMDSVKSMTVNVNSRFRTIRTITLKDGNTIFKLDDKGLKDYEKVNIEKKFKEKFHVPLNARVKNKLEKGIVEQLDSILRCTSIDEVKGDESKILDKLVTDKIIKTKNIKNIVCQNESCGHVEEYISGIVEKCSECLADEIIIQEYNKLEVDNKVVDKYIKEYLGRALNSENNNIEKSDKFKEYACFRFLYSEKEYNVIITSKILSKKFIKSIEKKLIPTIIIYYGIDNEQAKLMTPNSIEMIQFAKLYANKDDVDIQSDILKDTFRRLEKMLHYQIVNAAMLANEDLDNISNIPSQIGKGYSATDFEDDIYALLKDIIFNSEKWGASDIGKPLPEGVLTFQYIENRGAKEDENRVAFTFDCKLTSKDEGYDLGRSEQRKAIEYVNKFNRTNEIQRYCNNNKELSSHLFISNKFKENQIENVSKYFEENVDSGNTTKPVFIDFRGILEFHNWYRTNYESIQKKRNDFYKELKSVLTTGGKIITFQDFKGLIEYLEECFDDDKKINLKRVKERVIK
ncbi:hypothetical protein [Clostridium sp. LP20]|uniref:hypothetical protein n=1 Tax=Clostridium sp. LP20 TaxID=3418665 RepID=UPI003EE46D73